MERLRPPRPNQTHDARRVEFLRRFLLHVLPSGLVRFRQFGFLANRVRKHKLELCRTLLTARLPCSSDENGEATPDPEPCPICKLGRLLAVALIGLQPTKIPDTS